MDIGNHWNISLEHTDTCSSLKLVGFFPKTFAEYQLPHFLIWKLALISAASAGRSQWGNRMLIDVSLWPVPAGLLLHSHRYLYFSFFLFLSFSLSLSLCLFLSLFLFLFLSLSLSVSLSFFFLFLSLSFFLSCLLFHYLTLLIRSLLPLTTFFPVFSHFFLLLSVFFNADSGWSLLMLPVCYH